MIKTFTFVGRCAVLREPLPAFLWTASQATIFSRITVINPRGAEFEPLASNSVADVPTQMEASHAGF